jgi:hypothetical protein
LDGKPETYKEFAADYFAEKIPLSAVQHIYAHKYLTDIVTSKLNSEVSTDELQDDIEEIGYPNGAI